MVFPALDRELTLMPKAESIISVVERMSAKNKICSEGWRQY